MIFSLSVKDQSIDSSGITNDYKEAICEYVWNGLEAHATKIQINYDSNEACGIDTLTIIDNGDGIVYEDIQDTFGTFLASQKNSFSVKIKSKSNKGKGRFSFLSFANKVKWHTTYKRNNNYYEYNIFVDKNEKEKVECTDPIESNSNFTETKVEFNECFLLNAENMDFNILESALLKEFAWYLYLYKENNINIFINDIAIDYKKYIDINFSDNKIEKIDGYNFEINLIVWKDTLREKFCSYFMNSNGDICHKETTSFNRNTVDFNHSVFVKSDFFDDVDVTKLEDNQMDMFVDEKKKKIFNDLKKIIKCYIEVIISNYLSQRAEEALIVMEEERKTFPEFSKDTYGQIRKKDFIRVTKELYKIEPKIFYKLKPVQEKSLLGFLNLLLISEERENVLYIIEKIVDLTPMQRKDFSDILKKTKMENILDTIKFLEDRYKVIELLKTIVYDMKSFANERDHIQKIVQENYWLFGERYNLASADVNMKKALENYLNILYGENNINAKLVDDLENERRMDIFLCNNHKVENSFETTIEENIVVELKAPKVVMNKKIYRQIEDYMDFIIKQPAFNSEYRRWKFIAVCSKVDEDIKNRYKTFEDRGKIGLVNKMENFEIYAYTWDDIFKMFELVHDPLLNKLNYDRDLLAKELLNEVASEEGREKTNILTEMILQK